MKILVKVGGTLLDGDDDRGYVARRLAGLSKKHELVVVHGGGKQLTGFLAERGTQSTFVNGLRVSDERVIDGAIQVIAGLVNKKFVGSFIAAGARALGLSGVDGGLTLATRLSEDLGLVGSPAGSNGPLLRLLAGAGYLPVVACLAADTGGTIYNVNADQMAVSCALAFGAQQLLFLTDVAGVKNRQGQVLAHLAPGEIGGLIASGVAYGGMQAKLEAASLALAGGVTEVLIASGHEPSVYDEIRLPGPLGSGTRLSLPPRAGAAS